MIQKKQPNTNVLIEKSYRFNILERMNKFTANYKKSLVEHVAKENNCSVSCVHRLMYLRKDATSFINYETLKSFADHFKVHVEELENMPGSLN